MLRLIFYLLILFQAVYFIYSTDSILSENSYTIYLPNGKTINAELALDKSKGLQGRSNLCINCGMIFVFDKEGIHHFWMKDTLINLAIIWIDNEGRITNIVKNAEPCKYKLDPYKECKVYSPTKPSKYVLEINPPDAVNLIIGMVIDIKMPD